MNNVVVLNADYTFLSFIDWKKALTLLSKERIEVVKYSETVVNTVSKTFQIPLIVKLTYFVDMIYKRKVSFSHSNVFVRDNYTCGYCGNVYSKNSKELTIDHIIPKSKGGKNDWMNCITACKSCNALKGNKMLNDVNMKLLFEPHVPTVSEYIMQKLNITGHAHILQDLYKEIF